MSDIESSLRQLQPEPIAQSALLVEIGRRTTLRSARKWRWLAITNSTIAVILAGLLVARPESATEVRIVYLSSTPSQEMREKSDEATAPIEPALPAWPLGPNYVGLTVARISDGSDDEPAVPSRSLRAADLIRDPSYWSLSKKSGER